MKDEHAIVKRIAMRVKGICNTFYMDNILFSSDLFDGLHTRARNCCGTVTQIQEGTLGTVYNTKTETGLCTWKGVSCK
jgi:hypothetical protein